MSVYDKANDIEKATCVPYDWRTCKQLPETTYRVGDTVTAITDTAGEGMLYRVERLNMIGNVYQVFVQPIFTIWGSAPLSKRKSKWTSLDTLRPMPLMDIAAEYARLGMFIRNESMRLSGEGKEENDH